MMLVRYMYSFDGKVSYGNYVSDVEDFKKFWNKVKNSIDWCIVDVWDDSRGNWDLCDCWEYMKVWKDNGWYKKGWKFMSGI